MSIVRNTQGKTAGVLECVSLSLCILDFFTLLYKGGFICSLIANNYLFTVVGSVWEYSLRRWKEIDLQEKASYSFGIINVSFSVVAYSPFQLYFIQIHFLDINEMQWQFWKSNSYHRYCLKQRPLERGVVFVKQCRALSWLAGCMMFDRSTHSCERTSSAPHTNQACCNVCKCKYLYFVPTLAV